MAFNNGKWMDGTGGDKVLDLRFQNPTDLAEHLGVTFQQVQKYERGVNRVGAGRLTRIADALGVPVSRLLGAN